VAAIGKSPAGVWHIVVSVVQPPSDPNNLPNPPYPIMTTVCGIQRDVTESKIGNLLPAEAERQLAELATWCARCFIKVV